MTLINIFPKLTKRQAPSKAMVYLSPLLAIFLTLLAGCLLFLMMNVSPLDALHAFFIQPISTTYGWSELGRGITVYELPATFGT